MTGKETIEWLKRYRHALCEERRLREAIAETRARAEATTRALQPDPVFGGSQESRIAVCVERLTAYQEQLTEQIKTSERLRVEIEQVLNIVPDAMQRHILIARYIDGTPWWKVAHQLYVSERWAKELHRRGVEFISKKVHASSSAQV